MHLVLACFYQLVYLVIAFDSELGWEVFSYKVSRNSVPILYCD